MLVFGLIFTAATIKQNTYWHGEIPLFERVLRFERLGRVHILLGRAYYFNRQYEQAIGEYQKALKIMKDYAAKSKDKGASSFYLGFLKGIYFDLAHVFEAKGMLKEAVIAYQNALGIDPGDFVIRNNVAVAYMQLNQMDEAMEQLKSALALNPGDLMSKTNLALCYIERGDHVMAEHLLKEVLALDPRFLPAQKNLNKLLESGSKDAGHRN